MTRLLTLAGAMLLVQPALALQFNATTYSISERGGTITLTVIRAPGSSGPASVAFSTIVNSASPDRDFIPINGTLTWLNGDTAGKQIQIQILPDSFEEEPQDFFVALSDATGEAIGANDTAQVIIEDPGVRFEELYVSVLAAPGSLELLVRVTGINASRVDFFEGSTLLGSSDTPRPDGLYALNWNDVPRGSYTIRARAVETGGFSLMSPSHTLLVSGPVGGANLALVHVDQRNLGVQNGSAANPYRTLQQAIDNAAEGAEVRVAAGTYAEAVLIDNQTVQLLAGYPGAGDFTTRRPDRHRVTVQPAGGRTGFGLYNAGDTVIDGFTVSGNARGFFIIADTAEQSYPKLRRNVITGNGEAFRAFGGGGIHAQSSLELTENQITDNRGGRGGGVSAGAIGATMLIQRNVIRGNLGYDDHGGGLYLMANGAITGNLIQDNEVGRAVDYGGWGGGLILFGNSSTFFPQVTLANNIVTGNFAINGSGVFFDEGARATLEHELIYKNRTTPDGGGAVMVDGCCGTLVTMNHCTVADNEGNRFGGNGLNADVESSAVVINSIFWNNGTGELAAFNGSTIQVSYTLCADPLVSGDGIIAGVGNLSIDPRFADAANSDYRLQTTRGRWSPVQRQRVFDAANSPGVDAAQLAADYSWESLPNGGRADLGVFGNRAEVDLVIDQVPAGVRITARGANGRPYQLETTSDLDTWSDAGMLSTTTGEIEITRTISGNRHYRLRQ